MHATPGVSRPLGSAHPTTCTTPDRETREAIHLTVANVNDEQWQAALDAGRSDVELLDTYADVVRTVMTNWFNHLVDTELDLTAAPPLP